MTMQWLGYATVVTLWIIGALCIRAGAIEAEQERRERRRRRW